MSACGFPLVEGKRLQGQRYGIFGKEKNIGEFLRRKGWGDKGMRWLKGEDRTGEKGGIWWWREDQVDGCYFLMLKWLVGGRFCVSL